MTLTVGYIGDKAFGLIKCLTYNLYNINLADVFVTGGFKSSMMDSICLNGKSIGQMHAEDTYTTCVFVQYGQVNIYTIEFSVDSNSETYTKLLPLFESGEGIELEIKEGLKFTTGYKTAKDVKFAISGDKFQKVGETSEMKVFFDGKRVNDGDLITVQTVAIVLKLKIAKMAKQKKQFFC